MPKFGLVAILFGVVACSGGAAKPAEAPANAAASPKTAEVPASSTKEAANPAEMPTNSAAPQEQQDNLNKAPEAQQANLNRAPAPGTTMTTGQAIAKMREFKDQACACHDTACADRVSDAMLSWSHEMRKARISVPPMSDEEVKVAVKIGEETGKCVQAAISAGSP